MNSATDVLIALASFVWVASLKTVLLIAVVLLLQKLCGAALSASGRYLLWLPVVLSLVMPLGFDTALPLGPVTTTPTSTVALTTVEPGDEAGMQRNIPAVTDAVPVTESRAIPATPASLTDLNALDATSTPVEDRAAQFAAGLLSSLPWLWLSGALAMLAVLAVSTRRMSALIARAKPVPPALQQVLQDCMQLSGCKCRVRILQSPEVPAPMISGLFKPVLLLPLGLAQQLDTAQLRHVFLHELTHLQRGDIFINWMVALVQALHWFNPVVWFAFFRLRQDRELACDAATLRMLQPAERASYGHTLLQLHDALPNQPVPALALGMMESANHLERRIHMLVQGTRNPRLQSAIAALLVLPLAAVAFSQPAPATGVDAMAPTAAPDVVSAAPATVASGPVVMREPAPVAAAPAAGDARPVVREPASAAPASASARTVTIQSPIIVAATETELAVAAPPAQPMQLAQLDPAPTAIPDTSATVPLVVPDMLDTIATMDASSVFADPALIQELADHLAEIKADRLQFIGKWEDMGNNCDARKDSFFGVLSASCQRIRTALQRGDILGLSYECYVLSTVHTEQLARYRDAGLADPTPINVEALLQSIEQELASICSKDSYSAQYPAFAAIVADAESPKYRNMQRMRVIQVPAWQMGMAWGDIMMNSTSMESVVPMSPFAAPAPETYYNPYAAQGAVDGSMAGGGNMGGGEAAPAAPAQ